jgi:ESCRT-II complex subunit VPS22
MREDREAQIKTALEELKKKLRKFSAKFREQIVSDPELCRQFLNVCDKIGLDPLVSDRSIWDDIFGGGRFLPEVSVQLLRVVSETRADNGGVMELSECVKKINVRRGGGRYANVNESDINRCVKELECLGKGILWIEVVGKKSFIFYAPEEIGPDSMHLIGEMGASLKESFSDVCKRLGWSSSRAEMAFTQLISQGVVWVDDHKGTGAISDEVAIYLAP